MALARLKGSKGRGHIDIKLSSSRDQEINGRLAAGRRKGELYKKNRRRRANQSSPDSFEKKSTSRRVNSGKESFI